MLAEVKPGPCSQVYLRDVNRLTLHVYTSMAAGGEKMELCVRQQTILWVYWLHMHTQWLGRAKLVNGHTNLYQLSKLNIRVIKQGSSLSHAPTKWLETKLSGVYCQMVTVRSLLPDRNCLMSTVSWLLLDGYI